MQKLLGIVETWMSIVTEKQYPVASTQEKQIFDCRLKSKGDTAFQRKGR